MSTIGNQVFIHACFLYMQYILSERPLIPSPVVLAFSIVTCLFCAWICGIFAIVYSINVRIWWATSRRDFHSNYLPYFLEFYPHLECYLHLVKVVKAGDEKLI